MATCSGRIIIRGRTCKQRTADDPVVRLQPFLDHPQFVVLERPGRDPAGLDLVFGVEHVDVFQPLVRSDRAVTHQKRRMRQADRQADSREHARRQSIAGPPWAAGSGRQLARRIVPVAGLTWLLTKLIVPLCGKPSRLAAPWRRASLRSSST